MNTAIQNIKTIFIVLAFLSQVNRQETTNQHTIFNHVYSILYQGVGKFHCKNVLVEMFTSVYRPKTVIIIFFKCDKVYLTHTSSR